MPSFITLKREEEWEGRRKRRKEEEEKGGRKKEKIIKPGGTEGDGMEKGREGRRSKRHLLFQETTIGKSINL